MSQRTKKISIISGNTKRDDTIWFSNISSLIISWHEIGVYDLPATIDYILEKTNKTQVHYNGHSQGGTSFLVMTSTRPDYNKKIKHASLFAPSAKIRRISPFIRFLSRINAIQVGIPHDDGLKTTKTFKL